MAAAFAIAATFLDTVVFGPPPATAFLPVVVVVFFALPSPVVPLWAVFAGAAGPFVAGVLAVDFLPSSAFLAVVVAAAFSLPPFLLEPLPGPGFLVAPPLPLPAPSRASASWRSFAASFSGLTPPSFLRVGAGALTLVFAC